MRASDCAIQALSEVVPDRVVRRLSAIGVGVYTGYIPEQAEYWVHVEINEGAYGGRCGKDGIDAIDVLTVNSRNTPIEETDWLFPMRTERYELRDVGARRPGAGAAASGSSARTASWGTARSRLRPTAPTMRRPACSAAAPGTRCA